MIYQPYRRYVHSVIHPGSLGDTLVVICFNNENIMRVKCTALIHAFITLTRRLFTLVICFIRIINARSESGALVPLVPVNMTATSHREIRYTFVYGHA